MPSVARGMQFTEWEYAYLLAHVGWQPAPVPTGTAPSLWVRLALDKAESQLDSSAYLPRKKNTAPGADGCVGYDFGASMWNERLNDYAAGLPDALVLFDWRENIRATLKWAVNHPTSPFSAWLYPRATGRNDTSLDVAGIAARVGPNPYAIERSPYWRMKANGVPVHDLLEPPRDLWVSPLPPAPLAQGQSGTPTSPLGIAINQLCHRLILEGVWVGGTPTWYFGSDWLRRSLEAHQTRMRGLGLWGGPIDGRTYTVEYRAAWDAVLRYNHMIGA